MSQKPKKTFYRRQLPVPPAVSFTSQEGRQLFRESLKDGYMEGYFILAEQFRTQDEPAYCGLSTLTMVLNALSIDPKRVWKGPWRWYNESMLDCCRSLDEIKTNGIEFDQFACLGRCNFLNMIAKRPNQRHIYPTKDTKLPIIEMQTDDDAKNLTSDESKASETADPSMINPITQQYFTLNDFRSDIQVSCVSANDPVIICSYSRKGLKQTGDGHFSPIAGYHKAKDMCLIMDVARFKYPPHWVQTEVLYNAMCRIDKSCGQTRGWIIASGAQTLKPYFFTFNMSAININNVMDINENICCCSVRFMQELGEKNKVNSVECHAQCNDSELTVVDVIKCLLGCLPEPLDQYIASQTEKFGIVLEKAHEIIKEKLMNGIRDCEIYEIVLGIFDNKTKNGSLIDKFERCVNNKIETITLMVLVIGNDSVWNTIANHKISAELTQLMKIDCEKYPEISHEIMALKQEIKHLREFILSIFRKRIEKNGNGKCCKDH